MHKPTILSTRSTILLVLLLAMLAIPLIGQVYYTKLATRMVIYALAALSLDLVVGYAGLICLAHAAYFGIGAYAAGILGAQGVHQALLVWPLSALAAALAALLIGSVSLRARGINFIFITLAFAQMAFYAVQSIPAFGGSDGFALAQPNSILAGWDAGDAGVLFYVAMALLLLTLFGLQRLVRSRFGQVIQAGRDNERRLASTGIASYPYQLTAMTISGGLAGLAGALLVNLTGFVSPSLMNWVVSGELLMMVIIGSAATLVGPILGAALFVLFEQVLSDLTAHWMLILGPILIVRVLFLKDGIHGLLPKASRAHPPKPPAGVVPAAPGHTASGGSAAGIEIRKLCKHYGALQVTDDVTLNILPGEMHALIGPNGAGTTTLIRQIGGEIAADSGGIFFGGQDITRLPVHARARMGMARSFQITSIFNSFSAESNVAMAVQAASGGCFRCWTPAEDLGELRQPARESLQRVGLGDRGAVPSAAMSHGEHRQLELAMALAAKPKVLLLDEPMAGLGQEDSAQMVALLRSLKGKYAILLVEHDMDAVFALADRISVLAAGRIIASGSPKEIRASAEVRTAYLGDD